MCHKDASEMPHICYISQLIYVHKWDNNVSIYTSYELTAIKNVTTSTGRSHQKTQGCFGEVICCWLQLKPSKYEFFQSCIAYLGHIMSKDWIETDPKKIATIKDWLVPSTVTEVQRFMGFTNYYQKFTQKYMHITKPINQLLSVYPQVKVVQKSLVVDISPKLTNKNLIGEQFEDSSIGPLFSC